MSAALVGYTGLVGANLVRQLSFDDLYNRSNIESIAGRHYNLLVCSGAPAEKWRANQEPDADRENLGRLMACLDRVQADRVVLISTVDVFPHPVGVDEHTPIDRAAQQPYGRHRHELEEFLAARFPTLVVRLPGLFGTGLKKNAVYDLLHDNLVDRLHPEASYQFYNLDHLWEHIRRALGHGLDLVHLTTEPVTVWEVALRVFGRRLNWPPGVAARYDLRSVHAELLGGHGPYLSSREQVLAEMAAFVRAERNRLRGGNHDAPGDFQPCLAG